jgi:formate--tetrahydrofolate ligase
MLLKLMAPTGVPIALATHWANGGLGAEDLARAVVSVIERGSGAFQFTYDDGVPLWDKMKAVASKIYGAADISADASVRAQIARLQADYGHYPVCVAKTQYSFTTDANLRGAPSGHVVNIREVRLAAGAEFIVMICGDIMTMPGLPKLPAAERIDLTEDGKVVGLF